MGSKTAAGRRIGRARVITVVLSLAALLVVLGAAPAAHAGLKKEFEVFQHCPVNNPEVTACVYSTTTSGEFHLGSNTVPINKTVVLQGGLIETSPFLVPPEGAEELSRTPLELPGGLLGIELLGNLNEVTATAEPTAPIEIHVPNFGSGIGSAVVMPIKVKLDNPLLGESCYIGSDSEPAVLHLTTGTTNPPSPGTPLTGSSGNLEIVGAGKINVFRDNTLVDNTFPAPGANGCGGILSPVVDPSVDLKAGLPSAAGTNIAKLTGTLSQTTPMAVLRQRALPEFGRCVKVPAEKVGKVAVYHGFYVNSGCTYESGLKLGKYEWHPGPGPSPGFSGSGKLATLETVGASKISCTESTNSGEYTGAKTAAISITFTGCGRAGGSKESCQSAGAAAGEIKTPALQAKLGFIKDLVSEAILTATVGWLLSHEPSVISAECGAAKESLLVTGSVISPVATQNKMSLANALKLKASGGKQIPEAFEEEPKTTLTETLGSIGPEQAGLTSTIKFSNQERMEIKGKAE